MLYASNTHTIEFPSDRTIEIATVPRSKLTRLMTLLTRLQALWIHLSFGTGELAASKAGWKLIGAVIDLIPNAKNLSQFGTDFFDINLLDGNYQLIEKLFLAQSYNLAPDSSSLNLENFTPCVLLEMNRVSGVKKLVEAFALNDRLTKSSTQDNPSNPETSPLKAAA